MIAVQGLEDIPAFRKQIAEEMARLDRETSATYFDWTKKVFQDVVEGTPQWSGDTAANWNYSVKSADYRYERIANKTGDSGKIDYVREDFGVFYRGHPYAVDEAMQRMSAVPTTTWRDPVFISNDTPIAAQLDAGQVKVRPVNLVGGVQITLSLVAMKWSQRNTP